MKLPDTNDRDKMALIGRQTVLRRAKKDVLMRLRDLIVPALNTGYDSTGLKSAAMPLLDLLEEIDGALNDLA